MARNTIVLHIDDEQAFLDITAELLETVDNDLAVLSESDPTRALRHVAERDIECVICDYEMPQMTGLELCERLREEHPDLPFFLFTANPPDDLIDRVLSAGATDFIQKEPGIAHFKLLANRLSNAILHYRTRHRAEEAEGGRGTVGGSRRGASGNGGFEQGYCLTGEGDDESGDALGREEGVRGARRRLRGDLDGPGELPPVDRVGIGRDR